MLQRLLPWIVVLSVVDGSLLSLVGVHFLPTEFTHPYAKQTPIQQFLTNLVYSANGAFLIFVLWVFCYFVHHLYAAFQQAQLERLQLEVSIREAELRHLRSQMDPHFLFNSLNTVRALISPENQEARGALTHLSELLRNSLQQEQQSLIPLKNELSLLESHLAIEQLRFGSRLQVKIDLSEELATYLVPPLLIQTLMENAIKHGISKREQGGTLTLSIYKNEDLLCCVIDNPGTLEASAMEGLGLANIRARLQHLYQTRPVLSFNKAGRIKSAPPSVCRSKHRLTNYESPDHRRRTPRPA